MEHRTLIAIAVGAVLGAALPGAYADGEQPVPAPSPDDQQQQQATPQATVPQTGPSGSSERRADRGDRANDQGDVSRDKARTLTASMDLLKLFPKTDVKIAYDYSRASSTYVYGLAANTVLPTPVPLAPVMNKLQRGTIDGRYAVTRHVALGLIYWFEKYDVNDFALGPVTSLAQPATGSPSLMLLGYFYRPYTANNFMGRFTYLW